MHGERVEECREIRWRRDLERACSLLKRILESKVYTCRTKQLGSTGNRRIHQLPYITRNVKLLSGGATIPGAVELQRPNQKWKLPKNNILNASLKYIISKSYP